MTPRIISVKDTTGAYKALRGLLGSNIDVLMAGSSVKLQLFKNILHVAQAGVWAVAWGVANVGGLRILDAADQIFDFGVFFKLSGDDPESEDIVVLDHQVGWQVMAPDTDAGIAACYTHRSMALELDAVRALGIDIDTFCQLVRLIREENQE